MSAKTWQCGALLACLCAVLPVQASESLAALLARVAYLPPEQAWLLLQQQGEAYLNDADYNYALGVYASNSGNYAQAINAFERTVLLRPTHAGAWLDLALAYKQAGDAHTALDLIAHIETLNPPAYLQPLIHQFKTDWQPVKQRIQLSYTLGHSSNPSAAATDASVPLYLGTWTELTLSKNQRPQASGYQQLSADWLRASQQSLWFVQGSQRQFAQNGQADQQQLAVLWQQGAMQAGRWQLSAAYSDLNLVGYQYQLSAMRLHPLTASWHAGIGYRLRRFQDSHFDNNALTAQLSYQPNYAGWQWLLGSEQENPTGQRPGGSAQRWYTQLQWEYVLERHKFSLFAYASSSQEQQNYASLIPLKRQLNWTQLGAYWHVSLNEQLSLKTGVQWGQQQANHPLFGWEDTQWSTALVWQPWGRGL